MGRVKKALSLLCYWPAQPVDFPQVPPAIKVAGTTCRGLEGLHAFPVLAYSDSYCQKTSIAEKASRSIIAAN